MAKTELRLGPSSPRAARSASRQPDSRSPSGMSMPTTRASVPSSASARVWCTRTPSTSRRAAIPGRPLAATVRLVEDALVAGDYYDRRDEGEPVAAFAWPMLLQAGGLGRLAGTRLELTPRGEAVLARPCYPALGELWNRWLR